MSLGKQLLIALQCHLLRSKEASSAVTSCHSSQNDLQCAIGSLVSSQIWGLAPASEQAAQFDMVGGDPAAPCTCSWCLPRGRHRRQDRKAGSARGICKEEGAGRSLLRQHPCPGGTGPGLRVLGRKMLGSAALSVPSKNGR